MNARPMMLAALLGALLAPVVSHAEDQDKDRASPKAFVKDSAITTKVKAKLAAEHLGSLAKIHVDTDANGIVYLSGFANSQAEADKAVAIARATENVRDVKSDLVVKPDK